MSPLFTMNHKSLWHKQESTNTGFTALVYDILFPQDLDCLKNHTRIIEDAYEIFFQIKSISTCCIFAWVPPGCPGCLSATWLPPRCQLRQHWRKDLVQFVFPDMNVSLQDWFMLALLGCVSQDWFYGLVRAQSLGGCCYTSHNVLGAGPVLQDSAKRKPSSYYWKVSHRIQTDGLGCA